MLHFYIGMRLWARPVLARVDIKKKTDKLRVNLGISMAKKIIPWVI